MKKVIRIGEKSIGKGKSAYIIAEAGSNHNGSLETAKELISAAARAGADAVKFQSFTAGDLVNPLRPDNRGGWEKNPAFPVIERLSLPWPWHTELMEHARRKGIEFLSTPFSTGVAEMLFEAGLKAFKIASGDITNEPLLRLVGSFGRPVILSTGASFLQEVKDAVSILREAGATEIALLQCTALYPPRFSDVNLRAMKTLEKTFGCPVGISDHTPGMAVALGAVAMGGAVIEKHLTLLRAMEGPDHGHSMEPDEFGQMVREVRNLETALGSPVKQPSEEEMLERTGARRGVYANVNIKKDTLITGEMLKVVRQALGLSPAEMKEVIGKRAARDLPRDMPLIWEDICR